MHVIMCHSLIDEAITCIYYSFKIFPSLSNSSHTIYPGYIEIKNKVTMHVIMCHSLIDEAITCIYYSFKIFPRF